MPSRVGGDYHAQDRGWAVSALTTPNSITLDESAGRGKNRGQAFTSPRMRLERRCSSQRAMLPQRVGACMAVPVGADPSSAFSNSPLPT